MFANVYSSKIYGLKKPMILEEINYFRLSDQMVAWSCGKVLESYQLQILIEI